MEIAESVLAAIAANTKTFPVLIEGKRIGTGSVKISAINLQKSCLDLSPNFPAETKN